MGVEAARPHTLAEPPPAWGRYFGQRRSCQRATFRTAHPSVPTKSHVFSTSAFEPSFVFSRPQRRQPDLINVYRRRLVSVVCLLSLLSSRVPLTAAIDNTFPLLFFPRGGVTAMAAFLPPPPGVLPSCSTAHGRLPATRRGQHGSTAGGASRRTPPAAPRAVASPPSRPARALPPGAATAGAAGAANEATGAPPVAPSPPPPVRWPARPSTVTRYKQARYVGEPMPARRGRLRAEFYAPRPPALGATDGAATVATGAGADGEEDTDRQLPVSLRREYAWARGNGYNSVTRFVSTWSFLGSVLARNWLIGRRWTYLAGGMTDEAVAVRRRKLGRDVRETILQLGPTFIKYV